MGHGKLARVYSPKSPKNRPEESDGVGWRAAQGVSGEAGLRLPCVKGRLRSSRVPAQGHLGLRRITHLHWLKASWQGLTHGRS